MSHSMLSGTNIYINLDLHACAIRKRQAHAYLYDVEGSASEPQNIILGYTSVQSSGQFTK